MEYFFEIVGKIEAKDESEATSLLYDILQRDGFIPKFEIKSLEKDD